MKKEISPEVNFTIRVKRRLSSIAESNNAPNSSDLKKWGFALRAIGILKSDSYPLSFNLSSIIVGAASVNLSCNFLAPTSDI